MFRIQVRDYQKNTSPLIFGKIEYAVRKYLELHYKRIPIAVNEDEQYVFSVYGGIKRRTLILARYNWIQAKWLIRHRALKSRCCRQIIDDIDAIVNEILYAAQSKRKYLEGKWDLNDD